jgi:hypothetical protein
MICYKRDTHTQLQGTKCPFQKNCRRVANEVIFELHFKVAVLEADRERKAFQVKGVTWA